MWWGAGLFSPEHPLARSFINDVIWVNVGWSLLTIDDLWCFNGQRFRLGLLRQEDQTLDVTRNAVLFEWFPQIGEGAWYSGDWVDRP